MGRGEGRVSEVRATELDAVEGRWNRALEGSATIATGRAVVRRATGPLDGASTAVETSAIAATGKRLAGPLSSIERSISRWARGSRIVSWFLAEPDPEVVVIDLRETYTVGPVLRLLSWVGRRAEATVDRTGLADAWSTALHRIEAEPLRLVGMLLVVFAVVGLCGTLLAGGGPGGWFVLLGLGLLATRERRSASELADTRVGRAVVAAFEPPEPPERDG